MAELAVKLSLEDLRALFNGDDPPAIAFRTGIAKEIISLYIKTTVNNELEVSKGKLIREEIDAIMKNGFLEFDSWGKNAKAKLPQQYKDSIQLAINETVDQYVKEKCEAVNKEMAKQLSMLPITIKNHVTLALTEQKIQETINKYVDVNITSAILASLTKKSKELG